MESQHILIQKTGANPIRVEAARQLTAYLEANSAFSLIRLGDGDVAWILTQLGLQDHCNTEYSDQSSIEVVRGVIGLKPEQWPRFKKALETASYLDRCDSIVYVRENFSKLGLVPHPAQKQNEAPETSNIIFEWTMFELGKYLSKHTCLFAGAEAAHFEKLWDHPEYQRLVSETGILSFSKRPYFHQIRENGRHYAQNLDLIKEDLRREILAHQLDTVFLSLATGAKILAYELAEELGVRVIDFGSMMRGLCYVGSSGYQSHRDMHHPFFFRLPYGLVMETLEQAHPELDTAAWGGKAHAQLAMELHPHEYFKFNTGDGLGEMDRIDRSPENLRHFREGYRVYLRTYHERKKGHPELITLHKQFRFWLLKKGIGLQGKLFRLALATKRFFRKLLGRNA